MSNEKSAAEGSKPASSITPQAGPSIKPASGETAKKLPQLGALEDDDEFEVSLSFFFTRQS